MRPKKVSSVFVSEITKIKFVSDLIYVSLAYNNSKENLKIKIFLLGISGIRRSFQVKRGVAAKSLFFL